MPLTRHTSLNILDVFSPAGSTIIEPIFIDKIFASSTMYSSVFQASAFDSTR